MNKEYTILPFAEVKIGQEFELEGCKQISARHPWVKISEREFCTDPLIEEGQGLVLADTKGCLVRIADCELEETTKICPLHLPLTVRGEGSDSWLEDAEGRSVVAKTEGLDDDEHVKFLNWIAALAK